MTTDATIRRATSDDAEQIAALIAVAFTPLPAVAWLVPDPTVRLPIMTANFRILVDHAIDYGDVELVEDGSAVAVWFPRIEPIPEPIDYERRLTIACYPWTDRFRLLDELFEDNHPTEPHDHGAFLAVHPDHQGRSLGSTLLRHHHAALDATGTPAYLEASSPGSRDLYLRNGYQTREPFTLPDGTPFWPMWRDPR